MLILNTLVKAGFTSGEINWNGSNTGGKRFNLDGSESTTVFGSYTISNIQNPSTGVYTATLSPKPSSIYPIKTGDICVSSTAGTGSLGTGSVYISDPELTSDGSGSWQLTSSSTFTAGTVSDLKFENIDTEGNFVQYYSTARYIKSSTGKWHIIGSDTNDEQAPTTTNLKSKKQFTLQLVILIGMLEVGFNVIMHLQLVILFHHHYQILVH